MADPNTRQGKRTPVTLKIKFKSETLEQFIERYAVDVSQGGIFIRTKEPLAVGTQMKFEFQLRDASPLIAGEGTVVWTRENDPSRPAIAPGMGVRFDRLADGSQTVLERILAEKAKQAPSRGNESPTKPPLFTDTPTRVAPAPLQEALGVGGPRRAKSDSEQTPLPPPRPFHSDADDFDEKAFEEATKVRSLEELAAQTAGLAGLGGLGGLSSGNSDDVGDDHPTNTAIPMPPDELAARRRAESALAEPPPPASGAGAAAAAEAAAAAAAMIDRESAPGLPEPPSRPVRDEAPKTKLGVEPAKAHTKDKDAAPRAVSAELSHPSAPPRSSAAPVVITILVLLAGASAAVWWFVIRQNVAEQVVDKSEIGSGSTGSAVEVAQTGSDSVGSAGTTGSAGSAEPSQFGTGSAGSATVETPKAAVVDTVIASSVTKGAIIEIVGTDQKGPAPLTAKLEKDKAYKARITAPGFTPLEVDVKGGQEKTTAKLVAKPHVIAVTTEPAGADIYVDSVATQKITPAEITLTPAQAAKSRVRVSLRRPGYRPIDQVVDASAFKDADAQMNASVNAKLVVQQKAQPTGGGTTGGGTTGGGNGSATTPTGAGTGSATTPTGSGTTTTPTGSGTTTTPPSGGTTTPPSGGTTTTPSGGGTTTTPSGGGTTTTPSGGGAGSAAKPPTPTPPAAGSGAPSASSTSGAASPTASNELP